MRPQLKCKTPSALPAILTLPLPPKRTNNKPIAIRVFWIDLWKRLEVGQGMVLGVQYNGYDYEAKRLGIRLLRRKLSDGLWLYYRSA